MKLFLTPQIEELDETGGIRRVVEAQHKYLPALGFEFVDSPGKADIVAAHVTGDELPRIDVLHLHGMYFDGDGGQYDQWQRDTNRRIVESARRARAITMPSEWAAMCFKRDMRLSPTVIPNGVDLDQWPVGENGHYVLWNKSRANDEDTVCDPMPAYDLAMRGVAVVTTFAPPGVNTAWLPENMRVTGRLPFAEMRDVVRHADVYLATVKEVFSLSVLEAMAAGVPVLGYRWGGTAEAVRHKVEGYLVEPGDTEGLIAGLEWIRENRYAASKAARERAAGYGWGKIIESYAALYRAVYDRKQAEKQTVAVVISCYNYARYLAQAVESVLAQTRKPDEIIIVDDGSTDNTGDVAASFGAAVKLISQPNAGVANARNAGIAASSSDFIVCLDADDALRPAYIETLRAALVADRALGAVWSKVEVCDAELKPFGAVWDFNFSWENQADYTELKNGVPAAAMFRREMWERAGGFKQIYHPAEDMEFWLRGLSTGFTARRVTDDALFLYRGHEDSASNTKEIPPVHVWHPWAKDKQFPFAAPAKRQPVVRSYSKPLVSVIIPVGPGHARYLPAALDSLLGQTFREWEAIVVDDTDCDGVRPYLKQYPFVRLEMTTGMKGAGFARNRGLSEAKAPLVMFLDSDDYLMPQALEQMVKAFSESDGRYIYTDWIAFNGKEMEAMPTPDYTQYGWLENGLHAVTVLMATEHARALGGFDEKLVGWEDWHFFIKAAYAGVCGVRLPEKLLAYRTHSGQRREIAMKNREKLLKKFQKEFGGKEIMACGSCGGGGEAVIAAKNALQWLEQVQFFQGNTNAPGKPADKVLLEFTGPQQAAIQYIVNGRTYQAANNDFERFIEAKAEDVDRLVGFGNFRVAS